MDTQCTLRESVVAHPVQAGLAWVVSYLVMEGVVIPVGGWSIRFIYKSWWILMKCMLFLSFLGVIVIWNQLSNTLHYCSTTLQDYMPLVYESIKQWIQGDVKV